MRDGRSALDALAAWLRSRYGGARVLGVGHRVVHGGAALRRSRRRHAARSLEELRKLVPLAPLHQPYNLAAIEAVFERLPGVPQVACFDTSFHRGQPAVAELVPLPREICGSGVQRYGFHGLSYEYIASVLPEVAPEIARGRVIVAHLGSGASLCALRNGKSVDSSLGFTALDGLCMGTRPGRPRSRRRPLPLPGPRALRQGSGDDPLQEVGPAGHLRDQQRHARPARRAASPAPGWPWTTSSTARPRRSERSPRCWAGSTGWSSPPASARTPPRSAAASARPRAWLGVELDAEANAGKGPRISTAGSKVSAWVIPTNEELMIARHTGRLLGLTGARA